MHNPTDRIAHTMAFVTPVMEHWLKQEINGSTMKDRSDDPLHHEQMLLPDASQKQAITGANLVLMAQRLNNC